MNTTSGQINENTLAGKMLKKTVKENNLKIILDIGTWNGLGSTRCFLEALSGNTNTKLISLETNEEKVLIAKRNLSSLLSVNPNASILWGGILKGSDIVDIEAVFPGIKGDSEFQRWHRIDMENIYRSPYLLDSLPIELDFVLFDGGEFTTYFEFVKIFPRCTRFIALDDTKVAKSNKIRTILLNNPEWKEIYYTDERNGFSLFERVYI